MACSRCSSTEFQAERMDAYKAARTLMKETRDSFGQKAEDDRPSWHNDVMALAYFLAGVEVEYAFPAHD